MENLMLEDLTSARALMGASLGFHIIFSTIAIGLPLFFLIAEGIAWRTGDETYRDLARGWGKVAAVLFAVGAVSGTILSFELGLLWPVWMDFSGAIIGLPFTLEGFAFFTEAIFLALYIYAWDRLSPRLLVFSTFMVAISAAASAFFVISVNAWMNQPAGFEMADGRVVSIDPIKAIFNPAMPYEVTHGTLSAYVATSFGIAGIYAIKMLRGDRSHRVRKALKLSMAIAMITIPLQIISGDLSARFLAHNQPVKFAAMEAQFETERGAPLRIGGIVDLEERKTRYAIEIPKLLSFLAYEDFNAEVRGLNDFPQDELPPVPIVHYSFQVMLAIGFALLFVGIWFWAQVWRRKEINPDKAQLLAIAATLPLGFIAIEAGWFVTEFGRQPWIIWHIMRTNEGVTPREGIFVVFIAFVLVYLAISAGLLLLLYRVRGRRPQTAAWARQVRREP
jgi:cytochrome d ubiquinol oxidase subunit I